MKKKKQTNKTIQIPAKLDIVVREEAIKDQSSFVFT